MYKMFFGLRYLFLVSLFGVSVLFFTIYIHLHVNFEYLSNLVCKEFEVPLDEYDYIVVGSGTAGSIVALRLAQEKSNKILLLEAGPYSNFLFSIPAILPVLQKSPIDWQYETVPQKYSCKGLKNNVSHWPMGKLFGGTHQLNNMVYVRGHKEDYKEWFKNNLHFNYETDVLEYYKRLENSNDDIKPNKPININNLEFVSQLGEAALKSVEILGYPINNLSNSEPKIGFSQPVVTTFKNERWTTSDTLLHYRLRNLKILTNSLVNKIIFKNDFEASAVAFSHLGERRIIRAKKSIILSAGVIGTPKILLLSGIGPEKHLKSMKIRARRNLPVGENLQDHISTGMDLVILKNLTLNVNIETLLSPISAYKYFVKSSGPWTTVGCEAIGFCHTKFQNNNKVRPNLQLVFINSGISADGGKCFKKIVGISDKTWHSYFAKLVGKQVVSILPVLLHPKSRGTMKLSNRDPFSSPLINPNYLQDPEDVNVLIEGIKIIKKIISTEPMQKLGAKLNNNKFPGCTHLEFDSYKYWECYIRHFTLTSYHQCCTCKMGPATEQNSVVDFDFRVIGTNKLFIADASVLPSLPSGNLNSVVAMVAEIVADKVKFQQFLNEGVCKKIEVFVKGRISGVC